MNRHPDDRWIPVEGHVCRKLCEYNPHQHAVRIVIRHHGRKVIEEAKLPPATSSQAAPYIATATGESGGMKDEG